MTQSTSVSKEMIHEFFGRPNRPVKHRILFNKIHSGIPAWKLKVVSWRMWSEYRIVRNSSSVEEAYQNLLTHSQRHRTPVVEILSFLVSFICGVFDLLFVPDMMKTIFEYGRVWGADDAASAATVLVLAVYSAGIPNKELINTQEPIKEQTL